MASNPNYTPSNLAALFVFNPLLGDEMTEGLKILSFNPKIDIDLQKTFVGLTEGLVAFTRFVISSLIPSAIASMLSCICIRDFSPNKPIESMHTEKHRYSFLECEKDYWMVLVVENPRTTKDAKSPPVYVEDELDDSILMSLLQHAYSLFTVPICFHSLLC
jgi:hypothetical protein